MRDVNLAGGIRKLEWLKCELLSSVAELNQELLLGARGKREALCDVLANLVMVGYLLAERLGFDREEIDARIQGKIRVALLERHALEEDGGLSALGAYLDGRGVSPEGRNAFPEGRETAAQRGGR